MVVMIQINIHEAKTQLSKLLQRVVLGEEIIIAKAGKPIAKITAFSGDQPERVPGQDTGLFLVPDDFDAPLPEDIIKEFEE